MNDSDDSIDDRLRELERQIWRAVGAEAVSTWRIISQFEKVSLCRAIGTSGGGYETVAKFVSHVPQRNGAGQYGYSGRAF